MSNPSRFGREGHKGRSVKRALPALLRGAAAEDAKKEQICWLLYPREHCEARDLLIRAGLTPGPEAC